MDSNIIYLAGKITGDSNYRVKFNAAELDLITQGYTVLNPAVLPEDGLDYAAYLRIGQAMLNEADTICLLPDWRDSPGAKREFQAAVERGMRVLELGEKGGTV